MGPRAFHAWFAADDSLGRGEAGRNHPHPLAKLAFEATAKTSKSRLIVLSKTRVAHPSSESAASHTQHARGPSARRCARRRRLGL